MNFNELQPIITLITEQEERLSNKIKDVHDDVKETNAKITEQNGRLRAVEVKVTEREVFCKIRSEMIDDELESMESNQSALRFLKLISKNPKTTGFLFFGIMYITLIVTIVAIDKQWIGQLFKALLP